MQGTSNTPMFAVGGIHPQLSMKGASGRPRSESGIGALMPWADRLWAITYVAHTAKTGSGTGLFEIDDNMQMRKRPESVVGTYANRLIHSASSQLLIGPHVIDAEGDVRTIPELVDHRLTATMEHLTEPEDKVYYLTMEGLLLEANLHTFAVTTVFDLVQELGIPQGAQPHFKGGHTASGRVVVTNNTYSEQDFLGTRQGGRLAEWDGTKWGILAKTAFMEVAGRKNMGQVIFATGWDKASAILKVFAQGKWSTYRLPKSSHTFDHFWLTEWTRIREVETERYLMDCHGMFYDLAPFAYGGNVWGIRPIASHLRVIPDFCTYRGFLVLASNQVTPNNDANMVTGQPQSGLWFGKVDDLWQFGKPQGWGGPWSEGSVLAHSPSDPFLMTGFDKKVLHLTHSADRLVVFTIEVDFLGTQQWKTYETIQVPANGYKYHAFPPGFSAHWVRLTADADCTASAQFIYT